MRRCAPGASGRSACARSARTSSTGTAPRRAQILEELLEKYAEHGDAQFVLPDVLQVPPISEHGTRGGDHPASSADADELRAAP